MEDHFSPLLQALVHHTPSQSWNVQGVHPGAARRCEKGAIDIYDHIDKKELRESYLAYTAASI
jgi:hypothetical protein